MLEFNYSQRAQWLQIIKGGGDLGFQRQLELYEGLGLQIPDLTYNRKEN